MNQTLDSTHRRRLQSASDECATIEPRSTFSARVEVSPAQRSCMLHSCCSARAAAGHWSRLTKLQLFAMATPLSTPCRCDLQLQLQMSCYPNGISKVVLVLQSSVVWIVGYDINRASTCNKCCAGRVQQRRGGEEMEECIAMSEKIGLILQSNIV